MDRKKIDHRKREERHTIRNLCAVLYLFLVLNVLGVGINFNSTGKTEGMRAVPAAGKAVEKPKIALTFDDGPNPACTGDLLDGLKERNVKATFFVLGSNVKKYPELIKRVSEEGHLIGNHTYNHIELNKVSEEKARKEINKTNKAVYKATGVYPEYIRPPYGECTRKFEDSLDMILVRWTIDPLDWQTKNTEKIVNKVVTEAEENAIILLHDCYDTSVEAAFRIIDTLEEEGYEFVTVDELLLD